MALLPEAVAFVGIVETYRNAVGVSSQPHSVDP